MTRLRPTPRPIRLALLVPVLPLAAALLGGCAGDEPPKYLPVSGEWEYTSSSVATNTCPADVMPSPLTTFLLDYDAGDSFDIELGAQDVTCTISGTDFDCTDLVFTQEIPGFDATLESRRTWEGEFSSERAASGDDITTVQCLGADCNLVPDLPCALVLSFEAEAL